jgi:hypothetical protein
LQDDQWAVEKRNMGIMYIFCQKIEEKVRLFENERKVEEREASKQM